MTAHTCRVHDPDCYRCELSLDEISTNDRAKGLMGFRTDGVPAGAVAFDQPCELGYWCPICKVPAMVGGEYDERLHWSEYRGFLWCEVCNLDLPSALCVPLDAAPDPKRPWVHAGPAAAVGVFLDTIQDVLERHQAGATGVDDTTTGDEA